MQLTDRQFDGNEKTAEVLVEHHKKMRKPGIQYLDFNRMLISPLRQLMRIYKDPKMELTKTLDTPFIITKDSILIIQNLNDYSSRHALVTSILILYSHFSIIPL